MYNGQPVWEWINHGWKNAAKTRDAYVKHYGSPPDATTTIYCVKKKRDERLTPRGQGPEGDPMLGRGSKDVPLVSG